MYKKNSYLSIFIFAQTKKISQSPQRHHIKNRKAALKRTAFAMGEIKYGAMVESATAVYKLRYIRELIWQFDHTLARPLFKTETPP